MGCEIGGELLLEVVLEVLVGRLEQEVGEALYRPVDHAHEDGFLVGHYRGAEVDEVVLPEPARQAFLSR